MTPKLALFGVVAAGVAILSSLTATAEYALPETQNVPLERILTNLTERVESDPGDPGTLHHLARAHAMAYAQKLGDGDEIKAWKGWRGSEELTPWFGFEPSHVPYNSVKEIDDDKKNAAANAHLISAIDYYFKALKALEVAKKEEGDSSESVQNTMKLGLAWCLQQSGKKWAAVPLYREVLEFAWKTEKEGAGLGPILYVETAGYLSGILDPDKHAKELAEIKVREKELLSIPRPITPIAVPLKGGLGPDSLVDRDARVRFDLDGSGRKLEWQWITNDGAWLVYDPAGTGEVTSAIQMFGSRSFLLFCSTGYEAMALLDDNGDGMLRGNELTGLALWHDANSDGASDPGEVRPVVEHGIRSFSVSSREHSSGIPFSEQGVTFDDGTSRPTYDLILESR